MKTVLGMLIFEAPDSKAPFSRPIPVASPCTRTTLGGRVASRKEEVASKSACAENEMWSTAGRISIQSE